MFLCFPALHDPEWADKPNVARVSRQRLKLTRGRILGARIRDRALPTSISTIETIFDLQVFSPPVHRNGQANSNSPIYASARIVQWNPAEKHPSDTNATLQKGSAQPDQRSRIYSPRPSLPVSAHGADFSSACSQQSICRGKKAPTTKFRQGSPASSVNGRSSTVPCCF